MPGSSSLFVARTLTFFNLLKCIRTVSPLNHVPARFAAFYPDVQSFVHLSRLLPWQTKRTFIKSLSPSTSNKYLEAKNRDYRNLQKFLSTFILHNTFGLKKGVLLNGMKKPADFLQALYHTFIP